MSSKSPAPRLIIVRINIIFPSFSDSGIGLWRLVSGNIVVRVVVIELFQCRIVAFQATTRRITWSEIHVLWLLVGCRAIDRRRHVCVCVCVVSPIESEYSRGRTSSPRWQFRHPAKIIVGTTRVGFLDRTPASTKTKTRTTRKTPKEDRRFDPNSSSALLSTHTHTPREGALTILLNPLARFGCPMLALLRQCSYFYTIYRMKIR
jgi:hypothetical protein